ncbi:hypothetical protein PCANC_28331 [Puccinia coronata f. sp. avenae]|uniref:Integrase catalytic domain-containing protein n=1 Tax=Puccinia coronata f. sp. avenae TaxID=200324 RepID=A0A2N5TIB3_9BASI|nr:hypothetical protein PCANC_28331 [Puccinia coronata f. sp. avenae]
MIQTLKDMLRRYCSFGTKFKDGKGYTHNWVSLFPAWEFAYNSSVHDTTGFTPFELEKGWVPYMPKEAVLSRTVVLHPTADSFRTMMLKAEKKASDSKREAQRFWQPLRCAKSSGPARCATAFSAEEKAGNRYFQRQHSNNPAALPLFGLGAVIDTRLLSLFGY